MFTGKRYSPMKGLGGYTSKMERKTRGGTLVPSSAVAFRKIIAIGARCGAFLLS